MRKKVSDSRKHLVGIGHLFCEMKHEAGNGFASLIANFNMKVATSALKNFLQAVEFKIVVCARRADSGEILYYVGHTKPKFARQLHPAGASPMNCP